MWEERAELEAQVRAYDARRFNLVANSRRSSGGLIATRPSLCPPACLSRCLSPPSSWGSRSRGLASANP